MKGESREPESDKGPPVSLRGLTVRIDGRTIIEEAAADISPGDLVLIAGPSGAGKTVLLKTLAGLIGRGTPGFEVEGSIRIGHRDLLKVRPGRGPSPAGIVFQNFALFDELSAEENIRFGRDHSQNSRHLSGPERRAIPGQLMDQLGIPAGVKVALLSGGQRQRLAIARALAFDPDLIAYDEPTSGLDPRTAARVVELIHTTGKTHGKTTVVVTHDWRHFDPIASRIYLLENAHLQEVSRDELEEWARGMERPPQPGPPGREIPPRSPGRRITGWLWSTLLLLAVQLPGEFLRRTGSIAEAIVKTAWYALPFWRSPRWGLRYLWHYLVLVASPSAWIYFGAAGVISGFVATYFTFKFLPFRPYTEPLLTEELLRGLGFALYRILVPVLITVLIAARCGAAVASDVGTRRYSQGIEAMESMGASPPRYLLSNILYALAIGAPLLVALSFYAARYTSLLVFIHGYPEHGPFFWDSHFHRDLREPVGLFYWGTEWLVSKVVLCGLGVGAIAYFQGMRPKHSPVDVSRGITSTIIWSTLFVLLVHFSFAFYEFEYEFQDAMKKVMEFLF